MNQRLLWCCFLTMPLAFHASAGSAQENFPTRPVRMLVGFSPGGGQDLAARLTAKYLTAAWGTSVVVENRPGANGAIAAEAAARSAPDGYTLHLFTANDTVNAAMRTKLPYDTLRDLSPVTALSSSPYLIGVHPSLPIKTTKDLVALARSKPGEIRYASSGTGSPIHLSTELFARMAGIRMSHIPYKGAGPALVDLVSGEIQVSMASIASFSQHVQSRRVKAVAVTSLVRSSQLPDVPTVSESGVKDYEATTWNGIMVPAKTPVAIMSILNRDIARLTNNSESRDAFVSLGAEPLSSTPAAFGERVKSEISKWDSLVKALRLQSDG